MTEPLSRSALHPRARSVARNIVASTERLVEQLQAEEWALVPETLRQRRGLLRELHESHSSTPALSCIAALRAAVSESERVVLLIVPADAAGLDT
jgi:hypothetical protein